MSFWFKACLFTNSLCLLPSQYSCGIFSELDADLAAQGPASSEIVAVNSGQSTPRSEATLIQGTTSADKPLFEEDNLYQAQLRKIRHIVAKADIRQGHRVLEIGSGKDDGARDVDRNLILVFRVGQSCYSRCTRDGLRSGHHHPLGTPAESRTRANR